MWSSLDERAAAGGAVVAAGAGGDGGTTSKEMLCCVGGAAVAGGEATTPCPPSPRRRRRPHHAVRVARPSRSRVDQLDGAGGEIIAPVEEEYSNGSIRQLVQRRYVSASTTTTTTFSPSLAHTARTHPTVGSLGNYRGNYCRLPWTLVGFIVGSPMKGNPAGSHGMPQNITWEPA